MLFFGACAAAVLAAMGWLTVEMLKLEDREAAAKREASLQTNIRLALWRMDSFAQLFIATESARPHLYYNSLFSPEQAYYLTQGSPGGNSWAVACAEDFRVPSPLLRSEPAYCRLHFQVARDASEGAAHLSSPRYPPSAENREFALNTQNVRQDELVKAAGLMEQLKAMAHPERLMEIARLLSDQKTAGGEPLPPGASPGMISEIVDARTPSPRQQSQAELSQRRQTATQAMNVQQELSAPLSMDAMETEVSPLTPAWLGAGSDEVQLVLLRTVHVKRAVGSDEVVQGVWVDWPILRTSLLAKVKDIFPKAELVPADLHSDEPERLATIPAVLRTNGYAAVPANLATSPRRAGLYVAWAGVLASLLAVGVVVRAIIDLGERRGRFVSAVTHELRTPLTTFCLYSEMLADGMVRDESSKRTYLATLKHESQRLARIVENVLCYARLSEVRASAHTEDVDALDLLDRSIPAMERRAEEAGMLLVTDVNAARGARLRVDPQTVERILMNLVDNACKYAHGHPQPDGSVDDRIHLAVHAGHGAGGAGRAGGAGGAAGTLEFIVADHGPGIPKDMRRAVFTPFNRSRTKTESTAPGLGLGLSLARGLARELGGELRLIPCPPGFPTGTAMALVIPAVFEPTVVEAPVPVSGIA
jgi:signal transduction histidine kinase